MWPIPFEISGIPIYSYGILHFLAVIVLALFGAWWFRRNGGDGAIAFDAAVAYPFAMFFLAHFLFVPMKKGLSSITLGSLLDVSSGGFWGGLAILLGILFLYSWVRRFPIWTSMDLFSPAVLLSLGIGKVGCLLSGCCWGGPSGDSFGLWLHHKCIYTYPKVPLHPLPLYDSLWAGIGVLILLQLAKKRRLPGTAFFFFIIFYSVGRFATEFGRYQYAGKTGVFGLYASQLVELACIAIAGALLLHALFIRKTSSSIEPKRIPQDRPIPEGTEQPSYTKRILALMLDLLLPCTFLGLSFFTKGDARLGLVIASAVAYFAIMVVLPRTPGQMVFGLSLVNHLGKRASVLRRFARSICLPIPLLSIIGVFRPLASSSCQSFHDMIAGLHVIK